MKSTKRIIALVSVCGFIAGLAGHATGYPAFIAKARKFGGKDCTFCHVDPEGGPPWNERGLWLVQEKERRKAEVIDVDWLANYKPEPATSTEETAPDTGASSMNDAERDVLKAERDWLDSYVKRDLDAMNRLVADEFVITYQNGVTLTKAEEIARLKSSAEPREAVELSTEDVKVRMYGDTAILIGTLLVKRSGSVERSRYTDVYIKRDGRWQVVASQLTRVNEPVR